MKMKTLPIAVIRNGLPRLGRKLAQGRPVTLAYLGGSITQAWPDGYAYQTTAWFKKQCPAVAFTEVNAGIGGTGSDLGAYRLRQDVLKHKPDLLFVEFAVNDSGEGFDVPAAMEGIVRTTRRDLGAECEMAFIYTLEQSLVADLQAERLPPASRLHEPVAEHYGLPSLNVALDVARRLKAGELTWADFARDTAHPYPRGHQLYCATLVDALLKAFAAPEIASPWPTPLTKDPWVGGTMTPIPPNTAFPGWVYRPLVNRGGWECFDGLFESNTMGHEAVFEFNGTTIGLFYQLGPESGDLLWAVDEGTLTSARVFDDHADKFWRPCYRILAQGLPQGRHRLRIQVGSDQDPRSNGRWVKLASLMVR
jgi:hypothetical protein